MGSPVSEAFQRILAGAPVTGRQLVWAGAFVIVWFLMDLIQFIDWLWHKF
jgi:hypothetical protein